jgi:hypothetical protein
MGKRGFTQRRKDRQAFKRGQKNCPLITQIDTDGRRGITTKTAKVRDKRVERFSLAKSAGYVDDVSQIVTCIPEGCGG